MTDPLYHYTTFDKVLEILQKGQIDLVENENNPIPVVWLASGPELEKIAICIMEKRPDLFVGQAPKTEQEILSGIYTPSRIMIDPRGLKIDYVYDYRKKVQEKKQNFFNGKNYSLTDVIVNAMTARKNKGLCVVYKPIPAAAFIQVDVYSGESWSSRAIKRSSGKDKKGRHKITLH